MFWDNFVALCSEKKTSPNTVAAELSLSSGSVTAWKRGASPRETTLRKIADYFNVTVDYLIGRSDQKEKPATVSGDELDPVTREIMDMLSDFSVEELTLVRARIAKIKESR